MAIGTITEEIIDSLILDSGYPSTYPNAIPISGDVFACVYQDGDGHGWLKTFSVDSEGAISDTVIASLEFDGTDGKIPSIIPIAGIVYLISYTTSGSYGGDARLYTISISNDGATLTPIDAWTFTSQGGGTGIACKNVSGTTYVVAYTHAIVPTYRLSTVTIADNGMITKSLIDTLDVSTGSHPRTLIHHLGELFIYASANLIAVVRISSAGAITDPLVNSSSIDVAGATGTRLLRLNDIVSPAYYAIFFREASGAFDGNITTLSVSYAGVISSVIETQKVSNDMHSNYVLTASRDVRIWCEEGPSNDGYVRTRSITTVGDITDTNVDSWEFDETQGAQPFALHISGNIFMIVYSYVTGVKAITLNISAPAIYPSDAIARVSSIRHIYRPGMYRMQVGLGDLGLDIDIAEAAIRRELEEEVIQEPIPDIPAMPTIITCPICGMQVLLDDWVNHLETYHPWLRPIE